MWQMCKTCFLTFYLEEIDTNWMMLPNWRRYIHQRDWSHEPVWRPTTWIGFLFVQWIITPPKQFYFFSPSAVLLGELGCFRFIVIYTFIAPCCFRYKDLERPMTHFPAPWYRVIPSHHLWGTEEQWWSESLAAAKQVLPGINSSQYWRLVNFGWWFCKGITCPSDSSWYVRLRVLVLSRDGRVRSGIAYLVMLTLTIHDTLNGTDWCFRRIRHFPNVSIYFHPSLKLGRPQMSQVARSSIFVQNAHRPSPCENEALTSQVRINAHRHPPIIPVTIKIEINSGTFRDNW